MDDRSHEVILSSESLIVGYTAQCSEIVRRSLLEAVTKQNLYNLLSTSCLAWSPKQEQILTVQIRLSGDAKGCEHAAGSMVDDCQKMRVSPVNRPFRRSRNGRFAGIDITPNFDSQSILLLIS